MGVVGPGYGEECFEDVAIEISLDFVCRVIAHEVDDEVMSNGRNEASERLEMGKYLGVIYEWLRALTAEKK